LITKIAAPPQTRRLSANARRALEMLASDPATVSIMLDQGFTRSMLIDLVSTGLAILRRSPESRQQNG
jgi:hypothetical protein